MGCLQSRPVQQENFNNLSHAEVQQKDIHRQSKDALIDSNKPGSSQEHSSSSMVTNHPMPDKMKAHSASPPAAASPPQFQSIPQPQREPPSQSVSQRSKSGTSSPHPQHSPAPTHQPTFDTVPSASATQTPQSYRNTTPQNGRYQHQYDHSGGDHFRPPISRQQSHSKSISSAREVPDRVGIKRSESRQRAVTTNEPSRSDHGSAHELPRPASKSDVLPAPSGRYGTLAPAQPISVERAEHASHEKDIRRSTSGGPPQNQSPNSYGLAADPRNPRPSISRTFQSQEADRYDPANKPLVDEDDQFQTVRHHDSTSRDENGMPVSQPLSTQMSREINKHNPRARAAKRQSHQWGAIPPPPAPTGPHGHPQVHPQAAMTPASHHQTTYRQGSVPSQYPTGSRTPQGTGVQQQGGWGFAAEHAGYNQQQPHMQQRPGPVMYNAPQHYPQQPYGQAMSPYGASAQYAHPDMAYQQAGMPRAQTYHADPRQQQHHPHPQQQPQRQMRPYRSQDIAPGQSSSPHPTPTPPPPSHAPSSPPDHHGSTSRKKKRKKSRRRLGDRGQISEKAFFEKYWIESGVLGEGSFARVRRITRKTDQAPFALKLIKKKGMSEDDLTALEKEISILQKLNHPNVVQITDFCDTSKRIYMVVEFCEGGDVFSRIIAQSKFSEKDASHVIASVTRGLEHCHANGIVHRDLKPDNLMYLTSDPHSEIKIIDFGLAGDLVDGPLKTPCGTAHYVAPEVLEGTSYGCEADMWSMGVILYMLLCGFPPFFDQTGNHHRLYKIIKKGEYSFPAPYWEEISEDAKDLIRNLLVKNPRERLTAQQALRHPWLMGDLVSEADFGKTYMTQMTHFNSSRHFTERRLGTEEASPMQQVSLFSAEWSMQGH